MAGNVCRTCGKSLPAAGGKPGRASVYCSAACRQKAYRTRQATSGGVQQLISEIERQVKGLVPEKPEPFYSGVESLSSSVRRLRSIARVARDASRTVTPEPVTNSGVTETGVTESDEAAAVRTSDEWSFADLVEPYRRELQVHCYRMVGSYDDSEDLVQETLLKAWKHRDGFEGRASLRAWLYKIATNASLDFLRRDERRPRPYGPSPVPPSDGVAAGSFLPWLQPFPDEDPEAAAESAETLELVFLAAIQHLPPRQRAVLIMRDVLGWPAADTAQALDLTVASVTSALQRARPALRERLPERRREWARGADPSEAERALLDRYMRAAADGDMSAMAAMLRADARITMPPNPLWFGGRDAILTMLAQTFDPASPAYFGRWRHLPTRANGQPALGGYVQRPGTRVYRAQVLDVLRVEDGLIAEITSFEPHLFPAFGLPLTLTD
ncbi:sigma-70 family RNA polymerase sigma factor [Actinomadura chibensis]|uniref:RNA polymerase sigma factor n=1 Tax=Actinomadura chibensis TaxID=392828 RepID=A0A5D0NPD8_9ACTN|nr:sigma-70 family RNA polymerase sigma factor [Actinomadura chibensis]TYB46440.1 sigma-70 family RNA polymerase sigma factor [Actinomadura chibensis]